MVHHLWEHLKILFTLINKSNSIKSFQPIQLQAFPNKGTHFHLYSNWKGFPFKYSFQNQVTHHLTTGSAEFAQKLVLSDLDKIFTHNGQGTTLLTLTSILPSHFFCPILKVFLVHMGSINFTICNLLCLVLQEKTY